LLLRKIEQTLHQNEGRFGGQVTAKTAKAAEKSALFKKRNWGLNLWMPKLQLIWCAFCLLSFHPRDVSTHHPLGVFLVYTQNAEVFRRRRCLLKSTWAMVAYGELDLFLSSFAQGRPARNGVRKRSAAVFCDWPDRAPGYGPIDVKKSGDGVDQ
jgi:hypothetical protein